MDLNKIHVLQENNEVLAIYKPAGVLVHADGSKDETTVVDWLLDHYPDVKGVGEQQKIKTGEVISRDGIVHRLDRDTSGVMLVARTQESFLSLKEQFKNRFVKKAYLALVYGKFKEGTESGEIDKPIARSSSDFRRFSAQPGGRGKKRSAKTVYHVLEQTAEHSLVFLEPQTGRTHQLRVHLKAIHHPIVCDELYAPKGQCVKGLKRQALHARAITWQDGEGRLQQVIAPVPEDFIFGLQELGFSYRP